MIINNITISYLYYYMLNTTETDLIMRPNTWESLVKITPIISDEVVDLDTEETQILFLGNLSKSSRELVRLIEQITQIKVGEIISFTRTTKLFQCSLKDAS